MDKKLASFEHNERGVKIYCTDGTSYQGDLLVGADGTYSTVHQHLYKHSAQKRHFLHGQQQPSSLQHYPSCWTNTSLGLRRVPGMIFEAKWWRPMDVRTTRYEHFCEFACTGSNLSISRLLTSLPVHNVYHKSKRNLLERHIIHR